MEYDKEWVGDVGHLALADASMSELLIDLVRMLSFGDLRTAPKEPDPGLTTLQAAGRVEKYAAEHAYLLPDQAIGWLASVIRAARQRNEILHAVALNRCGTCGSATLFQHPRTGQMVDRSPAAVRSLTEEYLNLLHRGRTVAEQVAKLVNGRIIVGAKVLANSSGEAIAPEIVHPNESRHTCGACNGDGRATASVTVTLRGFEVAPDEDEETKGIWLRALGDPFLFTRNDSRDEER